MFNSIKNNFKTITWLDFWLAYILLLLIYPSIFDWFGMYNPYKDNMILEKVFIGVVMLTIFIITKIKKNLKTLR